MGLAPDYITDLLTPHKSVCSLSSSSKGLLVISSSGLKGQRSLHSVEINEYTGEKHTDAD